jgi:hypothetical protein
LASAHCGLSVGKCRPSTPRKIEINQVGAVRARYQQSHAGQRVADHDLADAEARRVYQQAAE